jgi:hypothetical protein
MLDVLNRSWAECKIESKPFTDDLVLERLRETLETLKARKDLYA